MVNAISPVSTRGTSVVHTWSATQTFSADVLVGSAGKVLIGGTTEGFTGQQLEIELHADGSGIILHSNEPGRKGQVRIDTTVTNATDSLGGIVWFNASDSVAEIKADRASANNAANITFGTQVAGGSLAEKMRLTSTGQVLIGDTASPNNDGGLTINQGTNDDEIFTLQETGIAHGVTDDTETDTFFEIHKSDAATGGAYLRGFNGGSATRALVIAGTVTTADSTRSTSGAAPILLTAELKSGTGAGTMGADKNLVAIRDSGTVRFIFDSDGSAHADVEWIAFDKYDDLALLDATQNVMTGRITPARFGDNSLYYDKEYLEDTGIVGKDSWHTEERDGQVQQRQMINFNKLAMLHHGAILQVGDRMIAIEKENAELRKMLEAGRN
jgi:hypothetical protein